ncbi:hypothetical protein GYMLUDRAFT_38415 [Collybiopsis luxurians FD-317 M1]|nr:hypothetical protein GYMLUDRAFT_38415 [Collybiopsis luxurians FD-317 M1]
MSSLPADSQDKILSEFREQLFSEGILHEGDTIGTDDATLSRFLRARKYNLTAAKKLFIDAQNWRKSTRLDELYSSLDPFDYPEREAVKDCWEIWFHKQGRPLNFHYVRGLDLERLAQKEVTAERQWETVAVSLECMAREIIPAAKKKYGEHIDSAYLIFDLRDFGLGKFWQMRNIIQKAAQICQDYYPETLGRVAVINAPSTFTIIWSVIRPWLAKETADKVEVLGPDYRERLLEDIDEENLPSVVGGKCRCEVEGSQSNDSRCHLSNIGPWLDGRVGWGPNANKPQTDMNYELEKSGVIEEDLVAQEVVGNVTIDAEEVEDIEEIAR